MESLADKMSDFINATADWSNKKHLQSLRFLRSDGIICQRKGTTARINIRRFDIMKKYEKSGVHTKWGTIP